MTPKVRSDVTVQNVGDESLVLDMESGQIHQLNATAAWILEQCNGERTVDSIASDFADIFSLELDDATNDVNAVIEQLSQAGIIVSD